MGNRYLLPLLFPAGFALAHALASPLSRWGFAAAAVYAAAVHAVLSSAWPHFPAELLWPVKNGALWFAGPRVGGARDLRRSRCWPPRPRGEPSRRRSRARVLPRFRRLAEGPHVALPAARGVGLFLVSATAPPPPNFFMRAWRAEIYGTASGRDPSLEELRGVLAEAATPAERRRADYYRRRYRQASCPD